MPTPWGSPSSRPSPGLDPDREKGLHADPDLGERASQDLSRPTPQGSLASPGVADRGGVGALGWGCRLPTGGRKGLPCAGGKELGVESVRIVGRRVCIPGRRTLTGSAQRQEVQIQQGCGPRTEWCSIS